ncbi:dihydrolipoamide acetyltransferase family protein [Streptomyces sp. NPDC127036]|uniref:dihydrolipoamide acetyltransferase family protein n=1 Tax=Streptomyces sp. NPDC127036 TaxID=3347112 RepID=UPI003654AAC8
MAVLMRVPEVAAGVTDVIFGEWLAQEGSDLDVGTPLAVIETDKAQVEIEAESAAVLLRVLVPSGTQVAVGAPMALLGTRAEFHGDLSTALAGSGVELISTAEKPALADDAQSSTPETAVTKRRFSSPLARKLLRDAGVDIATVTGTGPGGRIVRRDAERAVARASQAPAPATTDVTTTPTLVTAHNRMRRAIANRLVASKREVPHFYMKRTVEVDALLQLRTDVNAGAGMHISVTDLVVKAVAVAHATVPEANVVWTEESLLQYASADIAVAIASTHGLVTPVVRAAEEKRVSTVSQEVRNFVRHANEGSLRQPDLEGGSITVTNLGMYDVDEFSAVINPPHSMILAVGAIRSTPVVRDGTITIASTMALVVSVDHRAVDGALAALWLDALVAAVRQPYRLLV